MEKTILQSIIQIKNKATNKCLEKQKLAISKTCAPNTRIPVWRVFYDNEMIKKHNSFEVTYKCQTCSRMNIVALNNMLRKLTKGITNCNTCKNADIEKRSAHSLYMKYNAKDISKSQKDKPHTTIVEKLKRDQHQFDEMDDDFKTAYFRHHLTIEEFNHIKPHIKSFHHSKFLMDDNFEYWPYVTVPNQSRFCPYIYDKTRDVLEKVAYIVYTCENCGNVFENIDLCVQKNKLKVLCKDCSFCNNTCKIRCTKNFKGECVRYQSKYELKFILFCNQHKLIVSNGPCISYICPQGKRRTYKIDFMIKTHGLLIELKDMHCWHQKQLNNGVWIAKEEAAIKYAQEHDMTYKIVFPKNYVEFCKSLLVDKI